MYRLRRGLFDRQHVVLERDTRTVGSECASKFGVRAHNSAVMDPGWLRFDSVLDRSPLIACFPNFLEGGPIEQ